MTALNLGGTDVAETRPQGSFEKLLNAWPTWAPLLLMALLYGNTMWNKQAAADETLRQMSSELSQMRKELALVNGELGLIRYRLGAIEHSQEQDRSRRR